MSEDLKESQRAQTQLVKDVSVLMNECRQKIDQLDLKLVELLNKRAEFALELGRLKKTIGTKTYQPDREAAVLKNVCNVNRGPLGKEAITKLFEQIINENRRLECLVEEENKKNISETKNF